MMTTRFYVPPVPDTWRSTIPRVLYRRFDDKAHAENFLRNGEIRFRSIAHYQSSDADEARRDEQEGSVVVRVPKAKITIQIPGTDQFGAEMDMIDGCFSSRLTNPEPVFTSCYSLRRNAAQRKFGRWLVKIHRARPWLHYISSNLPDARSLFWGRVEYFDSSNPGELLNTDRIWLKKPLHLRHEHEFRLLLAVHGYAEGKAPSATCRIVMDDMSDYAELIDDPQR